MLEFEGVGEVVVGESGVSARWLVSAEDAARLRQYGAAPPPRLRAAGWVEHGGNAGVVGGDDGSVWLTFGMSSERRVPIRTRWRDEAPVEMRMPADPGWWRTQQATHTKPEALGAVVSKHCPGVLYWLPIAQEWTVWLRLRRGQQ